MNQKTGMRVAKFLARVGLCSRREAERWISGGRVSIGNKVLEHPATNVHTGQRVFVDGKLIPNPEHTRVWRYHKPRGLVTTNFDPEGRPTVFERLPQELPRVISVGRLDLNSEGLLLLTNDGELARKLELPGTQWSRRYRVRAFGKVDEHSLNSLKDGKTISGVNYSPIEAKLEKIIGQNSWITMSLREGKNREIRKVMEYLGLKVNRLIRVSYGPFHLGKLSRGNVAEVHPKALRENLKIKIPPKNHTR